MVHLFKNIFIVCIFFTLFTVDIFANGRQVTVVLKDDTQKTGELLLVRDSVVALLTADVYRSKDIVNYPQYVVCIRMKEINYIVLHKVSGITAGALGAVGLAGGVAVYNSDDEISNSMPQMLGGFAFGFILGWMVRFEKEEVIAPLQQDFWDILDAARFEPEPKYISDFIDGLLKEAK